MVLNFKNANSDNFEAIRSVSLCQTWDCCVWLSVHVHRARATEGIWGNFGSERRRDQCVKNYLSKIMENRKFFPWKREDTSNETHSLKMLLLVSTEWVESLIHSVHFKQIYNKGICQERKWLVPFLQGRCWTKVSPRKYPEFLRKKKNSHSHLFCSNLAYFFPVYFLIEHSGRTSLPSWEWSCHLLKRLTHKAAQNDLAFSARPQLP